MLHCCGWSQLSFWGQPLYCNRPYYPTARFQSPSSHVVSAEPFLDRQRPMSCKSAQMGSCRIPFLWLWPVTDHEPHSWHVPRGLWHVPTNKIWRWTETTPWSRWGHSNMAGIDSDHSTRETKWNEQLIFCITRCTSVVHTVLCRS